MSRFFKTIFNKLLCKQNPILSEETNPQFVKIKYYFLSKQENKCITPILPNITFFENSNTLLQCVFNNYFPVFENRMVKHMFINRFLSIKSACLYILFTSSSKIIFNLC